jgi:hypothetical protein
LSSSQRTALDNGDGQRGGQLANPQITFAGDGPHFQPVLARFQGRGDHENQFTVGNLAVQANPLKLPLL